MILRVFFSDDGWDEPSLHLPVYKDYTFWAHDNASTTDERWIAYGPFPDERIAKGLGVGLCGRDRVVGFQVLSKEQLEDLCEVWYDDLVEFPHVYTDG